MVNKIKHMNFSDARYIILKSLDTRDEIGEIFVKEDSQLTTVIATICSNLEMAMMAGEGGLAAMSLPEIEHIRLLVNITQKMPCYLLQDISSPLWEDFLSAWICLIENFTSAIFQKIGDIEGPVEDELRREANTLLNSLNTVDRLINCGIAYVDLIQATTHLLQEIKTWSNVKPTSVKLSEAYLQALDFYKEK